MKYIITESKLEKSIIHYLNEMYGDLEEYRVTKYPNTLFIRGRKIYMEHDIENDVLSIDNNLIWSDLKNIFSLSDHEIQHIIDKWVKKNYNIRVKTPRLITNNNLSWMERLIK